MTRKCVKWGRTKSRRVCRKFSKPKTRAAKKTGAKKASGKKTCVRFKKVDSPIYNTKVKRCAKWSGGKKKAGKKARKASKSKGKGVVAFMTRDGPVSFKAKGGKKRSSRGARLDPSFQGIVAGW